MAEEDPKDEKADGKKIPEEEQEEQPENEEVELKDRILRMAAEFDNYKKRVAKEIDASKDMGRADVITRILPTLDEFQLAIDSFDKKDEHVKGITLIYSNLMSALKSFGLREIESKGKFDPYKHEIMLVQESSEDDDVIIGVVRKGYMLNTIMLRPASVIVSKHVEVGNEDEKQKKSE